MLKRIRSKVKGQGHRGQKGVKLAVFPYLTVESLLFIVLRRGLLYFIAYEIAQL